MPPGAGLLTSGAVCRRITVNGRIPHRTTITRWFRQGILPGRRMGRGWRITLAELESWLLSPRAGEYGAGQSG